MSLKFNPLYATLELVNQTLFGDTNSVDFTKSGNNVSADVRISSDLADSGNLKANATIHSGSNKGLHIQVPVGSNSSSLVIGNDSRLSITHVLNVKQNPGSGEFSTISAAIAHINAQADATIDNPYLISVGSGTFIESELTIPSYVSVRGQSIETTVIQPDTISHNIFNLNSLTEISFMTIQGAGTGYAGISGYDCGDFIQAHKLSLYNNDTHILLHATSIDSVCYLEYVDIDSDYASGIKVVSENGFLAKMNAENFYTFPSATNTGDNITVNGTNAVMYLLTSGILGASVIDGIRATNGGVAFLNGVYFEGCINAIYIDNIGSNTRIESSSIDFRNCTFNINVNNTTATGHHSGYTENNKTSINDTSSYFIAGKDTKVLTVSKKGGDFSSIKSAIDSISDSNIYVIDVGPGIFVEDTITGKVNVTVQGNGTIVSVDSPAKNAFVGVDGFTIKNITITGASNSGSCAVYYNSTGNSLGQILILDNVIFRTNNIQVKILGTTYPTTALVRNCISGIGTNVTGFYAEAQSSTLTQLVVEQFSYQRILAASYPTDMFYIKGAGVSLNLSSSLLKNDTAHGNGIHCLNGAIIRASGNIFSGFVNTLYDENSGSGCNIKFNYNLVENSGVYDILIANSASSASISGTLDKSKLSAASGAVVSMFSSDPVNGGTVTVGKIFQGADTNSVVDVTDLLTSGPPMGLMSGGGLSSGGGMVVSVAAGFGYLKNGTALSRVNWANTGITLSANVSEYIYFNSSGILSSVSSVPDTITNIVLGRAVTNGSTIEFLDESPFISKHAANNLDKFNRNALGAIFDSGALVTESGTRKLNISSGQYYFSDNKFSSAGLSAGNFTSYYQNGSGGWTRTVTNTVDNAKYDNASGTLQTISSGNYIKHSLYIVGEGVTEAYMLVYGQTQFASLALAEQGNIPTQPTYFTDGVVLIGSIIVRGNGSSSNSTYPNIIEIRDERPVIGFKASGVSATTTHGNLLGLSADDHPQYLKTDGSRALTGSLDVGGNSVTNVNLVDGVDVSSHASRHLPGGSDELYSYTPVNKAGDTMNGKLVEKVAALTDATTISLDASLGNIFDITLGGNRTLGAPINPTNGQKITIRIRQDGTGSRTLAFNAAFRFGTDFSSVTLTTIPNKTDYLGCLYNGTDSKWDVIAYIKGF